MRRLPTMLVAAAVLVAGPALAQSTGNHRAAHPRGTQAQRVPRTAEGPIDRGPFTPDANRAYQGGGVILQGAPGAPAPMPQATPPGQAPVGMVPPMQ